MCKLYLFAVLSISIAFCANGDIVCASPGMVIDITHGTVMRLSFLPHQAGICDLIFSGTTIDGTIVTNQEECAADFAVDDVLWGHVSSSNITIRTMPRKYVPTLFPFEFLPNERYLVCAFTNNWWVNQSDGDMYYQRLGSNLSITSSPPGKAVLDGYRTMYPYFTVIPFSQINYNGSNYWPTTRTYITNLVHVSRIRHDAQLMRQAIVAPVEAGWANSGLPPVIWDYLWEYKTSWYDLIDNLPPPPSPQKP